MKKRHLSDVEQKVLAVIQKGFPNSPSPFQDMAAKADMETGQLLDILKKWKRQGKLRRVGAVVNHFKAGLGAGAMVAWQVEPEKIENAGRILAGFKQVSHAYQRKTAENWPYNLYTMVHANDTEDVERIVRQMSRACGVTKYRIMLTERELKKVPPTYVAPEWEDEQTK
jgi:DNA-binding Lrp family transcriptional regulator